MSERGQHRGGRGSGRGLSSFFSFGGVVFCSLNLLSDEQEADFMKVNTAEVEAAQGADMMADEEVTAAIASDLRKKTSSIWENTWTRRSA